MHGLITEELDGPEPSPAALDAIVAYVDALTPAACRKAGPITLAARIAEVDSALDLAHRYYAAGDAKTGRALVAAARSTLGAIDERFQVAGLETARGALREADAELFQLQQSGRRGSWADWSREWPRHKRALLSAERKSLYNPGILRKLVAAR